MLWIAGGATAFILLCCGGLAVIGSQIDDDQPGAGASSAPPTTTAEQPTTGAPAETTQAPPAATEAVPSPTKPKPAPPPVQTVGDGTWLVPADVKPGNYAVTVPEDSTGCYWQRSKNAEGDLDAILANDNVNAGAHVVLTIRKTDKAFTSNDCGEWKTAPTSGPKATTFGEGTWAVDIDIAPGTYAVTVPADSSGCYWERMKSLSGGLGGIVANNNVDAGSRATVTIKSSDKGFKSSGCGTWKRR
ncbi:hypothetical protein ACIBSW_20965 [Actinoplanes sp. NPDC049668]|uniref:hypothetical protein n=1 Tax=unclassified Actinoplanes TaxID=2626549 RepID=UPI0033AAAED6